MFKKSWSVLMVSALGIAAQAVSAGEVIVEGKAFRNGKVHLTNHMQGQGRSELYGAADCGGVVRGEQFTSGQNGGFAGARMTLQSIGGETIGRNYTNANGPCSTAQSDLTAGSYHGRSTINNSAVAGPCGDVLVVGRSFAEFGGHSQVDVNGFAAGYGGGRGAVDVNAYGRSVGPFTYTDVSARGIGELGGFGSATVTGTSLGITGPAISRVRASSEAMYGGQSRVEASDYTVR